MGFSAPLAVWFRGELRGFVEDTLSQEAIRADLGDENVRVSAIGPAGENLCRFALIDNDGRQVGRTGPGAVMGSKRIKAIALRGSQPVTVADQAL